MVLSATSASRLPLLGDPLVTHDGERLPQVHRQIPDIPWIELGEHLHESGQASQHLFVREVPRVQPFDRRMLVRKHMLRFEYGMPMVRNFKVAVW